SPTAISLTAKAGLTNYATDPAAAAKYRVGGETKLRFDHLSVGGDMNVNLPMILSIQGSTTIPRLGATFHFQHTVDRTLDAATQPAAADPPTTFEFDHVGIDLGLLVNNFLRPATEFLNKPLSEINWLIDDQPESVDGTPT